MIDISILRDEPDLVRRAMTDKGYNNTELIDQILELDASRRELLTSLQKVQTVANSIAKDIGMLFREGKKEEAEAKKAESTALKSEQKELEEASRTLNEELKTLLLEVPNIPHPSVPVGATPNENQVAWQVDELPSFDFKPLPHWELAQKHGLLDFERGAKVTGAGFPFVLDKGARLQRALINFFLDVANQEGGYKEMLPPIFVNADSAMGTGQLPDKEDQMYEMPRDGFLCNSNCRSPSHQFPSRRDLKASGFTCEAVCVHPLFSP